jgi:predicted alpha-1,2-mannosidase
VLACRDAVVVPDAPDQATPLRAAEVDPFIGTGGRGYRVGSGTPAASYPFGLVKVGPDTSVDGAMLPFYHCAGYHHDDTHVEGFSHLHLPGVGLPDYGTVQLMPVDGWTAERRTRAGRRRAFSHADEIARPGWYEVRLADGMRAAMSATRHGAHHRYAFPDTVADPVVVFDLGQVLGGESLGGHIEVDASRGMLRGWSRTRGSFTSDLRTYMVAEVDGGFERFGTWGDDVGEMSRVSAQGASVGGWIAPRLGESRYVSIRIGISLTSLEAAEANLRAELPAQSLEQTADAAMRAWDEALSGVRVGAMDATARRMAASALWRTFALPQEHGDADGGYVGFDGDRHVADGWVYRSDMSLWDTYRTVHPLLALIAPERARDAARSLLAMAEQGGALPRWPAAGGDGGSMVGAPADIVLADAVLRDVDDIGIEAAWPRVRDQARGIGDVPYNARPGLEDIDTLGYLPSERWGGSVAWLQELGWADAALAGLAARLGEPDDTAFFDARARTFANVYDPETGFFRGRRGDGTFEADFDPLVWQEPYVEGNAWQYLWMPFPRWEQLGQLLGGPEAARARLDTLFEGAAHEGVSVLPQTWYWHGNEPDIHAAWLYTLWGDRDATWRWVRWIAANHYADAPAGLPGNDDGGTLSAWYLLAGFGLFPIAGTDGWVPSAPLFPLVELPVPGGTLTVRREGEGEHVASVTLDGTPLEGPVIPHATLASGGELVVTLSP